MIGQFERARPGRALLSAKSRKQRPLLVKVATLLIRATNPQHLARKHPLLFYICSMLTIVAPSSLRTCHYKHNILGWAIFCSSISTNSAIHRGIRKSSIERGSLRSNFRDEGHRTSEDASKEPRRAPRIRRPNHLHKQDVEDMEESAAWKRVRRSSQRKRSRHGGRKHPIQRREDFTAERESSRARINRRGTRSPTPSLKGYEGHSTPYRPTRSAPPNRPARGASEMRHSVESSERRSHSGLRASRDSRDMPRRLEREITPFPNRAARRTSRFGHNEDSTEGRYHGSPKVSRDSEHARPRNGEEEDSFLPERVAPYTMKNGHNEELSEGYSSAGLRSPLESKRDVPGRKERYTSHLDTAEQQSFSDRPKPRFEREDYSGRECAADVPLTVPYTTPASEFLYGTSVVSAALEFSNRKFYKLYSYSAPDRANHGQDQAIRRLARSKGVEVMQVQGEWLRVLDKMSIGRPHNVCYNDVITIQAY